MLGCSLQEREIQPAVKGWGIQPGNDHCCHNCNKRDQSDYQTRTRETSHAATEGGKKGAPLTSEQLERKGNCLAPCVQTERTGRGSVHYENVAVRDAR